MEPSDKLKMINLSQTSIPYFIRRSSVILCVFTCKDVCQQAGIVERKKKKAKSGFEPATFGWKTFRIHNWASSGDILRRIYLFLNLVRTNFNYRVLGTSTASIFLLNDHSLYVPITSDEYNALFNLYGTSWPARSASKATKYKMKSSWP